MVCTFFISLYENVLCPSVLILSLSCEMSSLYLAVEVADESLWYCLIIASAE